MNCNGKERYSDGSAELKLFSLKELGKYIRALVLFGKALLLGPCVSQITVCRECRLAPLATDHQKKTPRDWAAHAPTGVFPRLLTVKLLPPP